MKHVYLLINTWTGDHMAVFSGKDEAMEAAYRDARDYALTSERDLEAYVEGNYTTEKLDWKG